MHARASSRFLFARFGHCGSAANRCSGLSCRNVKMKRGVRESFALTGLLTIENSLVRVGEGIVGSPGNRFAATLISMLA